MDLAALRAEVQARGFEYATTTRVDNWINAEYRELCSRQSWPFLETSTTVAGAGAISDVRFVQTVVHTTEARLLTFMDRRVLAETFADLTAAGDPSYWFLENDILKTYPVTTDDLAVRYVKIPAKLAAGTDEPIVPDAYHEIIVDGAVARGYKDAENWEAYGPMRQELERAIGIMVTAEMRRGAPGWIQSKRMHEGG